ncbi:alpha/beta fold hydrolase [Lactiplantibacillus sp. WILCCON 0030]|uniref:Alpha/beta fold hydrolase n=1 Tax=Lactiplantibacillus brownii TaxID=3069269 RepID=A0ABU1A554_9LACO|nr:alpha/beta fold hydrolase [Lactiplantibacillus brownii]MDQ7936111.1 alpha/beta fold hydrolase [Lactiplantibacillus brownii]
MSIHSNNFYSNTLRRSVTVQVILPEPLDPAGKVAADFCSGHQPLPVIWLLHGLGGDATTWIRQTAIETLATQYRVAVVMPQTERGFYNDVPQGPAYWTFMTEELPTRMRFMFPLSAERNQNFVVGNSMGGYGALRWALAMPDKFAAVAALSPVTDLASFRVNQAAIMPDFDGVFDSQHLHDSPVSLDYLLARLPDAGAELRVLMTTGSEDMLRPMDVAFKPKLAEQFGDRFTWKELPGRHDWPLWNQQLPMVMHWLRQGSFKTI